jgi:hypothetical protein
MIGNDVYGEMLLNQLNFAQVELIKECETLQQVFEIVVTRLEDEIMN